MGQCAAVVDKLADRLFKSTVRMILALTVLSKAFLLCRTSRDLGRYQGETFLMTQTCLHVARMSHLAFPVYLSVSLSVSLCLSPSLPVFHSASS